MRTCPSSGAECYAEVCKTWPCHTKEEGEALLTERAAVFARRNAFIQPRFETEPEPPAPEPTFKMED